MDARGGKELRWALLATVALLTLLAALLVATAAVSADRFKAWAQEDGWIEWSTFLSFLFAAVAHAAARPARDGDRLARWLGLSTALFCVMVAGEEISWGQRLLGVQAPEVFLEKNYQQELNVHNLLKGKSVGGFKLDSRYLVLLIAAVFGVVLPLAARAPKARGWRLVAALRQWAPSPVWIPLFLSVAVVEQTYPVDLAGEGAELFLGLGFLADGTFKWAGRAPGVQRLLPLVAASPILLGLPMQAVIERVLYDSDEVRVEQARREVALLAEDLRGSATPLLQGKSHVHKRVFTAIRDGYFQPGRQSRFLEGRPSPAQSPQEGEPRRDRVGYLLDPWNNPYWVEYRRSADSVVVYSFGPNRRRDSELESEGASAAIRSMGDDVAQGAPTLLSR